eukprot:3467456-Rhodomonas_salina.1
MKSNSAEAPQAISSAYKLKQENLAGRHVRTTQSSLVQRIGIVRRLTQVKRRAGTFRKPS